MGHWTSNTKQPIAKQNIKAKAMVQKMPAFAEAGPDVENLVASDEFVSLRLLWTEAYVEGKKAYSMLKASASEAGAE
jgi:hypothetical protein